ncbi:COQ9 family protein [Caulobacter sp. KR2-114]|uniref:COQ9 family protein n=1 Tax=Caulobacter sp. KR2-114 TaxID=3400912 RepID=UPI003C0C0408
MTDAVPAAAPANDLDASDWVAAQEARLLDAAVSLAPRYGWSGLMLKAAARRLGVSDADVSLVLPQGPRDLAALMSRRHDGAALRALEAFDPQALKVRERIRQAVLARVEAAVADEPATRRWSGFLALPGNIPLALRLVWESADLLWRWAGDTATDENHYSKRAILSEILITTLAIRLSGGANAAAAHLDGRIAAVMAFETWKAGVRPLDGARRLASALGRLRYGRAA